MRLLHRGRVGCCQAVFTVLVFCSAVGPALPVAADEMRYSLGTVQVVPELSVSPGSCSVTTLLLYNIDGNVPTQVELSVLEVPAGWEIRLEHDGVYSSRGSTLSLRVAPSLPSSTPPESVESGRETVWIEPRGYVCADAVHVYVQAPATAAPGAEYAVAIGAEVEWNVTGAAVSPLQAREFLYGVHVSGANAAGTPAAGAPGTRVHVPLLLAGAACLLGAACLRERVV